MFGNRSKYQSLPTGGRSSPRSGGGGGGGGGGDRRGSSNRKWMILGGLAVFVLLVFASGKGRGGAGGNVMTDDGGYAADEPVKTWPINESPPSYEDVTDSPPKTYDDALEFPDPSAEPPKEPSGKGGKIPSTPSVDSSRPPKTKPVSTLPSEIPKPSGPTSPEDDPDATSTTYCTSPAPGKKLVQYALMIDAGSTGSRIHVYKFNYCSPSPMLEYEVFSQTRPGLSSFKNDPKEAAGSLNVLMAEAMRVVPESLRSCTPLAVKATAGLRLLGKKQSQAILKEVEHHLGSDFPFPLIPTDPVVIMDGKDEGVYAWITANYLLSKIGEGSTSTDTLAVMDLGGASTQIVFEPTFTNDTGLVDGDHKYALTFGGRDFILYQHSYLGYGLMQARRHVHNLVAFTWSFGKEEGVWEGLSEKTMISTPCLGAGRRKKVELDPPGREKATITMVGGSGGYESCKGVVELVMAKDAICEVKPCSFNGVYQPSLLDTFPSGSFLALSYFYDRISPLLAPPTSASSAPEPFSLPLVKELAQAACSGEEVWRKKFEGNEGALKELEEREEYCLDLTFMHALLGLGYEIGEERELIVEKQLRDVELGWALGAGLAMLDGDLKCLV